MPEKVWRIKGSDGDQQILDKTLPFDRFLEEEIITVLKCLASCHLDKGEVMSSFLPEDDKWYTPHLEVTPIGGKTYGFMTSDTNYTATVEEE